jgi:N-acetyl-gamma-glutamyl-phosphate reductase common form
VSHPVYLLGARGLLAGEFLRLLADHPQLHLAGAYARSGIGTLGSSHPQLGAPFAYEPLQDARAIFDALASAEHPVLVLALPHGASGPWWAEHRAELEKRCPDLVVVDLSADFRLQDAASYASHYQLEHACPEELGQWSYGLPELYPVAAGIARIATPGCFATALQLAILPFVRAGQLDYQRPWIAHGVTGSSGSGAVAKPATHHPHRTMNFHAYGLQGHRHEAEFLAPRSGLTATPELDFTPHSAPLSRGIHLHAVLPLAESLQGENDLDPQQTLVAFCAPHAFLEASANAPQVRFVAGSNRVQMHAYRRGSNLHCLLALDNTIKGGAGQALQCLNLALGFSETTALPSSGLAY